MWILRRLTQSLRGRGLPVDQDQYPTVCQVCCCQDTSVTNPWTDNTEARAALCTATVQIDAKRDLQFRASSTLG